jgi:hypothetical protein
MSQIRNQNQKTLFFFLGDETIVIFMPTFGSITCKLHRTLHNKRINLKSPKDVTQVFARY